MSSLPEYPADFIDWKEVRKEKAIVGTYVLLLSPDKSRLATICLDSHEVVSIYNNEKHRLDYLSPLLRGMKILGSSPPTSKMYFHKIFHRSIIERLIREGIRCAHCGVLYLDRADFIERNPRRGHKNDIFVDSFCWDAYVASKKAQTG